MKCKYTWAYLVHLSTNMWYDRPADRFDTSYCRIRGLSGKLLFNENVWREWVVRMLETGVNQVVIDVGDGVVFPSHPELAIEGSWSPEKMLGEVRRLRKMGIEAIPKLNFSTSHDSWLKHYHRQVSTSEYYRVCEDLIGDIADMFDRPRLMHIGYDEETPNQQYTDFAVVRQGELWWKDFHWFLKTVEKKGMRPWCWADAGVNRPEEFISRCPKSALLSNWYYWSPFDSTVKQVRLYEKLDKAGFDQVPCGSVWGVPDNFQTMVSYCSQRFDPSHLKGFMMASWARTLPRYRDMASRSFDAMSEAISVAEYGRNPRISPMQMWIVKDGGIDRWYRDTDRIYIAPGEMLVVDFGRLAKMKPIFELEGGDCGCELSFVAAGKTDGAELACPPGSVSETIKARAREQRYDGLAPREMRFAALKSHDVTSVVTGVEAILKVFDK